MGHRVCTMSYKKTGRQYFSHNMDNKFMCILAVFVTDQNIAAWIIVSVVLALCRVVNVVLPTFRWIRGVDSGGNGVLTTWKYVGGIGVCFYPVKCHIFLSKLLLDNCTSFTASKVDVKLISRRLQAVENLDRYCWFFRTSLT